MPNGKPGDHPLTDLMLHGHHPYPPRIEELIRLVLKLDYTALHNTRADAETTRLLAVCGNEQASPEELARLTETLEGMLEKLQAAAASEQLEA